MKSVALARTQIKKRRCGDGGGVSGSASVAKREGANKQLKNTNDKRPQVTPHPLRPGMRRAAKTKGCSRPSAAGVWGEGRERRAAS